MTPLELAQGPWIALTDGSSGPDVLVHGWTLGRMAGLHRCLHGQGIIDRAHRTGITTSQLRAAEERGVMSHDTAQKLLSVCGYEAGPFAQPHLDKGLRGKADHAAAERLGRIACVNELADILGNTVAGGAS